MARGGGGGGGHSGGGHSSRGFSGGGHSSSHRGSSSSFSSHRGSSSRPSSGYRPSPGPRPWGGSRTVVHNTYVNNGGYRHRRYNSYNGSILWPFLELVIIFIALFILLSIKTVLIDSALYGSSGGAIPKSTYQREPLPVSASTSINEWFEDDWNWIGTGNETKKALREFQKETGVQIFLSITPNTNGKSIRDYAEEVYNDKFGNDSGHAVFVWYERDNGYGNGDGNYETYLLVGNAASAVLDDEAVEIVLCYFDQNYANSSLNEDELLANTFSKSAERIMHVTKSPMVTIIILIGVIVALVIALKIIKEKNRRKKEEAAETERILNTKIDDIDTFESKIE